MSLTAARQVLIPVQAEYFAARRIENLLDVVGAVKQRTNSVLEWWLLVTMFDQRNRICRGVVRQLKQNFPRQLLETVIGVDTRLRESPAVGEPITVYSPHTRASKQYLRLAKELHQSLIQE
jgi:chromosome partitioning protein